MHDHLRAELTQVRDLLTDTLLSHLAYEEREGGHGHQDGRAAGQGKPREDGEEGESGEH